MSKENRRCKVIGSYDEPEGTFIKYAPIAVYDDSGQLHTPEMAIVELDDGKVMTVKPTAIKFIK